MVVSPPPRCYTLLRRLSHFYLAFFEHLTWLYCFHFGGDHLPLQANAQVRHAEVGRRYVLRRFQYWTLAILGGDQK